MGFSPPGLPPPEFFAALNEEQRARFFREEEERLRSWEKEAGRGLQFSIAMLAAFLILMAGFFLAWL